MFSHAHTFGPTHVPPLPVHTHNSVTLACTSHQYRPDCSRQPRRIGTRRSSDPCSHCRTRTRQRCTRSYCVHTCVYEYAQTTRHMTHLFAVRPQSTSSAQSDGGDGGSMNTCTRRVTDAAMYDLTHAYVYSTQRSHTRAHTTHRRRRWRRGARNALAHIALAHEHVSTTRIRHTAHAHLLRRRRAAERIRVVRTAQRVAQAAHARAVTPVRRLECS
jgi:hypothetical protein